MVNDPETSVETIEVRLSGLEKRFDDLKWYFGGVAAVVTSGIAVYSILIGMNFSSEKAGLQNFRTEMRQDLNISEKQPNIELMAPDGRPLSGALVSGTLDLRPDKSIFLHFETIIRNGGSGSSGPMSLKFYSTKFQFGKPSTDENAFKYEYYEDTPTPNTTPGGGYTSNYGWFLNIKAPVQPGTYPMLCKLYYGSGKVASAQFSIVLK
jgi:hypothetical protein